MWLSRRRSWLAKILDCMAALSKMCRLPYFGWGVEPQKYQASLDSGEPLPSLHSSQFAPDYPLTIKTGVRAMTRTAMDLFNSK